MSEFVCGMGVLVPYDCFGPDGGVVADRWRFERSTRLDWAGHRGTA
jgi:hypothetical protein